jgi:hypothetical protein
MKKHSNYDGEDIFAELRDVRRPRKRFSRCVICGREIRHEHKNPLTLMEAFCEKCKRD